MLPPTSWEEEEEGSVAVGRSFSPAASPRIPPGHVGREQQSALGSHRSSPALLSLFLFILPRCISTSVGRGDVPAWLITACLPEFPRAIPAG